MGGSEEFKEKAFSREIKMTQSKADQSLVRHLDYDPDYITAYQLSGIGCTPKELNDLCSELRQAKRTFSLLEEAVLSDRHPYTIMMIAAKIGMYIPPRKRVGVEAYNFLVSNIHYYDNVSQSAKSLTINEVLLSRDRIGFLMRFRDNEILKAGYKFSRNYSSRLEMIQNFITNNVLVHGEFKLESNSRHLYGTKAKVIRCIKGEEHLRYSTTELLSLLNERSFSKLSLHHLKQQILEKLEQWKHRDHCQNSDSPQLLSLLGRLEHLL